MKRTLLALTLAASLSGCATIGQVASSKEAFVACQAADAVTTYVALSHRTGFVEANPIMRALIAQGWLPFVAFKAGLIWFAYWYDASPPVQTAFNAIACLPVPYNLGNL